VKPRLGALFNAAKAAKLQAMLESSIQRRFPRGLKVHVHSVDRFGCLAQLTRTLKDAGLSITRAKVAASRSLLVETITIAAGPWLLAGTLHEQHYLCL